MSLILLVVLVSLAGSFLCSLCEAALYAVTPTRVETLRSRGGAKTGTLRDLMRPAVVVPENTPGHQLLEQFISQHQHLAVVSDEHGKLSGVVSLEDVLEYLLGRDIVAEHDKHPEMRRLARERARFHAPASEPLRKQGVNQMTASLDSRSGDPNAPAPHSTG